MRLQAGQTFAGYRVLKQLGRGGMAYVYLAEEPGIERRVALKLLPEEVVGDRGAEARFEQEAKTVASLEHPHIVPLYRHGIERGAPWMALRFVEGGDLAERMNRPLAIPEGLSIFRQIAAALDFAHQKQVVHRDLKPQNVLLSPEGHVYLADFGIAKLLAGGGIRTGTGGILGTPQYMAPEYARGEVPGPAADIYALGVMAFQWQTGCLPFDADTPQAVLFKQVLEPLPEEPLQALPPRVLAVLRQVLDKDPAQRHPSAGAFVDALAAALMSTLVAPEERGPQPLTVRPQVGFEESAPIPRAGRYGAIALVIVIMGLLWFTRTDILIKGESGSVAPTPTPATPAPATPAPATPAPATPTPATPTPATPTPATPTPATPTPATPTPATPTPATPTPEDPLPYLEGRLLPMTLTQLKSQAASTFLAPSLEQAPMMSAAAGGERFLVRPEGVYDAEQGVIWAASDNGSDIDWNAARSYCAGKGAEWSLPTVLQLQSLYDESGTVRNTTPIKPATLLIRFTAGLFWSSEASGSSRAFRFGLYHGDVIPSSMSSRTGNRALCVLRP